MNPLNYGIAASIDHTNPFPTNIEYHPNETTAEMYWIYDLRGQYDPGT